VGVLIKCDFCGEVFESDVNQRLVVSVADQIIFAGYLCPKCSRDFVDYIKKHLGAEVKEAETEEVKQ